jgi:transposase
MLLIGQDGQQAGFQYSWFCEHYRAWAGKLDVVVRQEHRVGEKLFVAVLGASSYTFAEITWSQQLPDWLGAHPRCFAFLAGIPAIVVPVPVPVPAQPSNAANL